MVLVVVCHANQESSNIYMHGPIYAKCHINGEPHRYYRDNVHIPIWERIFNFVNFLPSCHLEDKTISMIDNKWETYFFRRGVVCYPHEKFQR